MREARFDHPWSRGKSCFTVVILEVLFLPEWTLRFSLFILFLSATGTVLRNLSIILLIVASDDVVDGEFLQIFRRHCSHDARIAQLLQMYTAQQYIIQTIIEPLCVRDTIDKACGTFHCWVMMRHSADWPCITHFVFPYGPWSDYRYTLYQLQKSENFLLCSCFFYAKYRPLYH
jgi:hypothetical protein